MSIRYALTYIRQIQPEKALSPSRLSDLKIAPKEVGGPVCDDNFQYFLRFKTWSFFGHLFVKFFDEL